MKPDAEKPARKVDLPNRAGAAQDTYETPVIRFVEISVQESLMGICKGGVGPATASPVCSACYGVGS